MEVARPGIVFYFLSGRAWLITDNSFTGRVTCSSEQGGPYLYQPVCWHDRILPNNIVWPHPAQASCFLLGLVTSSDIQWHGVTWSHVTLCKCNCWRDDRRDFTSPLNTNLIFQWRSQAPHCSQSSLSLIVWTKSMNSQILCVYGLREALNTWLFLPNLAKLLLLTWHYTLVINAMQILQCLFSTRV